MHAYSMDMPDQDESFPGGVDPAGSTSMS